MREYLNFLLSILPKKREKTEPHMEHSDLVREKRIQDKLEVVDYIDFVVLDKSVLSLQMLQSLSSCHCYSEYNAYALYTLYTWALYNCTWIIVLACGF